MVRIAISETAYQAILSTLPSGSVAVEPERDERGQVLIWIEPRFGHALARERRSVESLSAAIVRFAAAK